MGQNEYEGIPDEMLLRLFQANKELMPFNSLYKRHFALLSKYIYWLTGDLEKGRDIAQDIFIKLYDNPHLFDTKRNFKVWLYSVAKNQWKNELRKQYTETRYKESTLKDFDRHSQSYNYDAINEVRVQKVQDAMGQLSEKHREAIVLKYSNNLTINEIAAILNCNAGTVKSRLFYALNHLKKILRDENK